ncbi:MAG: hypothetical protein HOH50_04545, partial [Planctomycetaceae bacterium]|nr:hypothetical protein [Planctomycetaceae bacterium]
MALLFVNADVVMAEVATKDDVVVESLIRDLSAPKFVTRQRAMSQLVAIG